MMRWLRVFGVVALIGVAGCEYPPEDFVLDPSQVESFGLADSAEGRFDWPISRSGFAVSRPPIYSSLIGLNREPMDEIDQTEVPPPDLLEGDDWARFLRAMGTNAVHPFQMKPIDLEIASVPVSEGEVSFTFSGDGDRLFVCDGAAVTAIEFADPWKNSVPLMEPADGKVQRELWKWRIPGGTIGDSCRLSVTAPGNQVENSFDWGVKRSSDDQEDSEDDKLPLSTSELVVVSPKQTSRLNLDSGDVRVEFATPAAGLDYIVSANDANVVLGTTPDGQVFWNGGETDQWVDTGSNVLPASQFLGRQSVAVNAQGTAFIAMVGKQPATVWMQSGKKTFFSLSDTPLNSQCTTVAWVDNGRNWCDDACLHFDSPEPEEGEATSLYKIIPMIWRPVSIWPQRAGRYSPDTGMTVLGLRRLRNGSAMWSVWDQNSNVGGNSCATELFDDAVLAQSSLFNTKRPTIAVSADASRIAYLDPTAQTPTIRVIYRNPWERIDNNQGTNWYRLRMMGTDEDRSEIERAAATIRSLPMDLYLSRPPEELHNKYTQKPVNEIIAAWTRDDKRTREFRENAIQARRQGSEASQELLSKLSDDYQDIVSWDKQRYEKLILECDSTIKEYEAALGKFEQWVESGSVTAKLAAAAEKIAAAWRARGYGMGYQVTQAGAETFESKSQECKQICLDLLQQPRPPMAAFVNFFEASKGTGASHLAVEPEVRRCVRLYPECATPHVKLGFWLLPRWGGQIGDTASYINAALSNADPSLREKVYGMTQIRMADNYRGNENYFSVTGASEKRTFRGSLELLSEEAVGNVHWIGPLIWVASYTKNKAVSNAACEYYREKFLYATGSVYQDFPSLYRTCFEDRPKPR